MNLNTNVRISGLLWNVMIKDLLDRPYIDNKMVYFGIG